MTQNKTKNDKDKFKSNPFAKKYKETLSKRKSAREKALDNCK